MKSPGIINLNITNICNRLYKVKRNGHIKSRTREPIILRGVVITGNGLLNYLSDQTPLGQVSNLTYKDLEKGEFPRNISAAKRHSAFIQHSVPTPSIQYSLTLDLLILGSYFNHNNPVGRDFSRKRTFKYSQVFLHP